MFSEEDLSLVRSHLTMEFAFATPEEAKKYLKDFSFLEYYPDLREWWLDEKKILERIISVDKMKREFQKEYGHSIEERESPNKVEAPKPVVIDDDDEHGPGCWCHSCDDDDDY